MRWVLPTSLLVVWLCGARLLPAHRPVAAREEWRMPAARAGKDRALFFLVNEYNDPLYDDFKNPEGNPIKDGHAIAKLLREQYGFETEILENPSLGDIGDKINEYAARYLSNEWDSTGQLMIYFSGHGESVRQNGYFVTPQTRHDDLKTTAFSYALWRPELAAIPCKHILVTIDACFSGTFDPRWFNKDKDKNIIKRPGEMTDGQKLVANHELYVTRYFFTSATEVRSPEISNFARKFREGLIAGGGPDGILSSTELFAHIELANPRPHRGEFDGDDPGSSFLFFSVDYKPDQQDTTPPHPDFNQSLDDDAYENARLSNTEEAYNSYLLLFRKGRHRRDAQIAIDSIQLSRRSKVIRPPDPFDPKMVYIHGGIFEMGCNEWIGQSCPSNELPKHQIKLSSFYIGRYEVTQSDWFEIMGEKASDMTPYCAECPVVGVSWDMIQKFLDRLNSKTAGSYRLPTEAEWEYAARGGARSKGFLFSGGNDLELVAWHDGNSGGSFHPVGAKLPNELGLYDMSGNVCEWCQDKWHEDYTGAPQDGSSWVLGGTVGRVFRGGCWNRLYLGCHTSARYWDYPYSKFDNVGFRLAKKP